MGIRDIITNRFVKVLWDGEERVLRERTAARVLGPGPWARGHHEALSGAFNWSSVPILWDTWTLSSPWGTISENLGSKW